MTKAFYAQMVRERRENKARGHAYGKRLGILKRIRRKAHQELTALWRGASEDSLRWLRENT